MGKRQDSAIKTISRALGLFIIIVSVGITVSAYRNNQIQSRIIEGSMNNFYYSSDIVLVTHDENSSKVIIKNISKKKITVNISNNNIIACNINPDKTVTAYLRDGNGEYDAKIYYETGSLAGQFKITYTGAKENTDETVEESTIEENNTEESVNESIDTEIGNQVGLSTEATENSDNLNENTAAVEENIEATENSENIEENIEATEEMENQLEEQGE